MAELFEVSTDNVGLHLKNLYEDVELSLESTTEESSVVQIEGTREVQRPVMLYNLDAILAVGYRGGLAKHKPLLDAVLSWIPPTPPKLDSAPITGTFVEPIP